MTKKTVVDIDELKAALKQLNDLANEMDKSGGAAAYTGDLDSIGQGLGPLLEDAGATITKYVDARKSALTQVHQEVKLAVGNAATMLSTTITNYENNENTQRTAADGTDTSGGNGSSSGNGSNGAGSTDQKG